MKIIIILIVSIGILGCATVVKNPSNTLIYQYTTPMTLPDYAPLFFAPTDFNC